MLFHSLLSALSPNVISCGDGYHHKLPSVHCGERGVHCLGNKLHLILVIPSRKSGVPEINRCDGPVCNPLVDYCSVEYTGGIIASWAPRSVTALFRIPSIAHSHSNLVDDPQIHSSACITIVPVKYAILPSMAAFVNDMFIFLAISYRLTANAVGGRGWRSHLLSVFRGNSLHGLSASLLHSGQVYFW